MSLTKQGDMSLEPKIQYCLLNILDVLYAFVLFSPFAPQFVIMNSPVRSLPSFLCLLSHTRIHQMLHFIYQLHCHSPVHDFKLLFGPLKFFLWWLGVFSSTNVCKMVQHQQCSVEKVIGQVCKFYTSLHFLSIPTQHDPSPQALLRVTVSQHTAAHVGKTEETTTFPGSRDQPACVTCQTARVPAHLTK